MNLLSSKVRQGLYCLANAVWAAYVWRRAHRHSIARAKELKSDIVERMLKRRIRTAQTHATINGVTGVVAGAASLVTATLWYGYPVLVLRIISSILGNYLWRHRIGYDRPLIQQTLRVDKISLIKELEAVASSQQILEEAPSQSVLRLVSDPESITSIIEFIVRNDFFEDFCIRLLKDTSLSTSIFGTSIEELTIDPQSLFAAGKLFLPRFLEIA